MSLIQQIMMPLGNGDWEWTTKVAQTLNSFQYLTAASETGQYLAIGTNSGVWTSSDYGTTWSRLISSTIYSFTFSKDGRIFLVGGMGSVAIYENYFSSTRNVSVSAIGVNGPESVTGVCISKDNRVMASASSQGEADGIFVSNNYGATWRSTGLIKFWSRIACSGDGNIIIGVTRSSNSSLFISRDEGFTWSDIFFTGGITGVCCSDNGTIIYISQSVGNIYASYDSGRTWVIREISREWSDIKCSADGRIVTATVSSSTSNGSIYYSEDYGVNWTVTNVMRDWRKLDLYGDGTKLIAVAYNDANVHLGKFTQ